jgi:hypothetical protein
MRTDGNIQGFQYSRPSSRLSFTNSYFETLDRWYSTSLGVQYNKKISLSPLASPVSLPSGSIGIPLSSVCKIGGRRKEKDRGG